VRIPRRLAPVVLVALATGLSLAGPGLAEVVERGNLRVAFDGTLTPRALPRTGSVPVRVTVEGRIATTNGTNPPQLRVIAVAINRHGHLDPGGLPVCRLEQIQPATSAGALESCGGSLVGDGRFFANVLLPEQAPFPSEGKILAFNGVFNGKPAILAHVFGTEPAPTSYTLPFEVSHTKGTYGTLLSASLPNFTSDWGYVTGLSMTLGRRFAYRGRARGYLSAACPAPAGFPGASFPLLRASFGFAGGLKLDSTLNRSCRVR
jgi:hypothetical protein